MEKKNLDTLFQREFSDFKETPPESVWDSIEASLDKKEKRRVIPIWWKLGGIAALLAVGLYILTPAKEIGFSKDPSVIISPDQKTKSEDKQSPTNETEEPMFNGESQNTQVTATHGIERSKEEDQNRSNTPNTSISKNKVEALKKGQPQIAERQITQIKKGVDENSKAIVGNTDINTANGNNPSKQIPESKNLQNTSNAGIVTITKEQKNADFRTAPIEDTLLKENQTVTQNTEEEEGKKSIFDAIAENEKTAEDKELKENEPSERWAVGPSVAPVYFDAVGEGSPIHSNFSQNSKSGNLNLSYGLMVSYDINKKLSVRSGVHRVDYGYDTNEISFSSSLQAPTSEIIDNITYSQTSRNLVVRSTRSVGDTNNSVTNAEFNTSPNLLDGRMVQQLGYVEVPLELNYALLDKKVGVNVIGGISSLFLVDNAVSLESDGLVTNLGKANNVNDVSFSTNIGLGINYRFSQKIQLNIEPVFKYQLNTFSETAGSFNPYTVGVYSGVQFRF